MNKFSLVLLFSLCACTGRQVDAATIYSQTSPSEPFAAFASNDSFSTSQRMADNFTIAGQSNQSIRSVRFIGTGGIEGSLSDNFRVVFFEDGGGVPGVPLQGGDFEIGSAFTRVLTGGQLLNGVSIPLEYVINLPTAVEISPDSLYWISITNDLLPATGWAWARADGALDQVTASTLGSLEMPDWDATSNGGMWFELIDQNAPEPSALSMSLMAAIAGIGLRRFAKPHYRTRHYIIPSDSMMEARHE